MALPNEHQLTFSQYPDAKSMFAAIETRFREQFYEDDLEALDLKWNSLCISCGVLQLSSRWGHLPGSALSIKKQGDLDPNSSQHQSEMVEEQVQSNMALMAFSDSEVYTDKTCSKTCLNNYETLKKQYDDLLAKQLQTKFESTTYKRGLDTVEAQLVTYRKMRPNKLDLSYSGLNEFKEPEFKGYGPENSKKESNIVKELDNSKENSDNKKVNEVEPKKVRENNNAPIIKDWVSDDEEQDDSITKPEKKTITHTAAKIEKPVRKSVRTPVNTVRPRVINIVRKNRTSVNAARANGFNVGKPQHDDKGFVDSGCSRHMTGNIAYLSDFKQFDGGYVAFGGGAYGGKITGKGTLKTANLDFEDVYFVNELKFNLFSVSQMCDKKNYVLFTDTECLVLSPNFKLPDENQILLKIPRKDNMYSFDMKNIVPKESLTCLVAKATLDKSILWHRILGHINFKNINKLVKDNLVRVLPTKHFENDQTYVACLKRKQHRASYKSKVLNPITKPLFMLHMDLFGPTFVSSLMHKKYCLVVTDDYSRFTWVFFLTTKDETSEILKNFIKEIENLVDKKVKIIRSDNGTDFMNKVMDHFCREKGIKREYSVARTPQQNSVAERRNRTLIEAARTILADFKLPTTFWAEAVSTAYYV
ncbi:putative ribonuclease H-like domain-containing protein [Tanacetum coccineum]